MDLRWSRLLASAAISLTPSDRYDNVRGLYCGVTEGQRGARTPYVFSAALSLSVASQSSLSGGDPSESLRAPTLPFNL